MIAFIDDHRGAYGIEPICKLLPIAPFTYHAHAAPRADPARAAGRARRDAELRAEIWRVHEVNFRVYGARKVGVSSAARGSRWFCQLSRQVGPDRRGGDGWISS
jgi:hypothetical protein